MGYIPANFFSFIFGKEKHRPHRLLAVHLFVDVPRKTNSLPQEIIMDRGWNTILCLAPGISSVSMLLLRVSLYLITEQQINGEDPHLRGNDFYTGNFWLTLW